MVVSYRLCYQSP